ncbi:hypothetical protein BB561_004945 [Smittium simulii]|uniref:Myosin motor domain-containing protein n=1 Tax=Smittium simulii TaxID=133385 RepID=A0A2T9YDB1_9FUNG|nr:hypothetical protein BB561_004945 [Smittium simulii]
MKLKKAAEIDIKSEKLLDSSSEFTMIDMELKSYKKDSKIYIQDDKHGYIEATITNIKIDSKKNQVKFSTMTSAKKAKEILLCYEDLKSGKSYLPTIINENKNIYNIADIEIPSEPLVLETLSQRYKSNNFYTFVGTGLVYVNPFNQFNMYASARKTQLYDINSKNDNKVPHINSVSKSAYNNLKDTKKQQSVLFLGSSGSGKSSNMKHFIDYLLYINNSKVKQHSKYLFDEIFESANVLIDSFCNTNTPKNNESSRNIKHISIKYNLEYMITDINYSIFLFELNRVAEKSQVHEYFSIFSQLIDAEEKVSNKSLGLELIQNKSIKPNKTQKSDSVLPNENLSKTFHNTCESLNTVGIDYEKQAEIFQILAAIIHVSKINILEQDKGASTIKSDDNILETLSQRYKSNNFYTFVGTGLVYVNPFNQFNMYASARKTQLYDINSKNDNKVPHINSVSKSAYNNLKDTKKQQSVLFLGSSGSGKSSNMKHFVDYLLYINNSKVKQDSKYLFDEIFESANVLIDSFCNTNTPKNNESSRNIKHISIKYNLEYMITDINYSIFLFELNRVAEKSQVHEYFSIFSQLIDAEEKVSNKSLGLELIQNKSIKPNKTQKSDSVLPNENLSKTFHNTCESLNTVGIDYEKQAEIFQILAAIIHVSKINILEQDKGASTIKSDDNSLELASELLKISKSELIQSLTAKVLVFGTNRIVKQQNLEKAKELRDSLCKHLYLSVFKWIIRHINLAFLKLNQENDKSKATYALTDKENNKNKATEILTDKENKQNKATDILTDKENDQNKVTDILTDKENILAINAFDVCGYSVNTSNLFEEFCINYANEKFYNYYLSDNFFNKENFKVKAYSFPAGSIMIDNEGCISIIEKKNGIISILASETQNQTKKDSQIVDQLFQALDKPEFQKNGSSASKKRMPAFGFLAKSKHEKNDFVIKHYFESVSYTIDNFTSSNRDGIAKSLQALISSSGLSIMPDIFTAGVETLIDSNPAHGVASANKTGSVSANVDKKPTLNHTQTVLGNLKRYLADKVNILNSSKTSYVFCIAPNQNKKGIEFTNKTVLDQIKNLKLVEMSHIHNNVFDNRMTKDTFIAQFSYIIDYFPESNTQDQTIVQIMTEAKIDAYYYSFDKNVVSFKTHAKRLLESYKKAKIDIEVKKVVKRKHKIQRKLDYSSPEEAVVKLQALIRLSLKKRYDFEQQTVSAILIQNLVRTFLSAKTLTASASFETDNGAKIFSIQQICQTVNMEGKTKLVEKLNSWIKIKNFEIKKKTLNQLKNLYTKKIQHKTSTAPKRMYIGVNDSEKLFKIIENMEKRMNMLENNINAQKSTADNFKNYIDKAEKCKIESEESRTSDIKLVLELKKNIDQSILDGKNRFSENKMKLDSAINDMQLETKFIFERLISIQQYVSKERYENTTNKHFLKYNIDIQNNKLDQILKRVQRVENNKAQVLPNVKNPLAKKESLCSSNNSEYGLLGIKLPSYITIKKGERKLTPFIADKKYAFNSVLHESFQHAIKTNVKKSSSNGSNLYSGIKEMHQCLSPVSVNESEINQNTLHGKLNSTIFETESNVEPIKESTLSFGLKISRKCELEDKPETRIKSNSQTKLRDLVKYDAELDHGIQSNLALQANRNIEDILVTQDKNTSMCMYNKKNKSDTEIFSPKNQSKLEKYISENRSDSQIQLKNLKHGSALENKSSSSMGKMSVGCNKNNDFLFDISERDPFFDAIQPINTNQTRSADEKNIFNQNINRISLGFLNEKNGGTLQSNKVIGGLNDMSIFDNEYQRQSRIIYADSVMFGGNFITTLESGENSDTDIEYLFNKIEVASIRKNSTNLSIDQQYIKNYSSYTKSTKNNYNSNSGADKLEDMLKSKKIYSELAELIIKAKIPRTSSVIKINKLKHPSNLFGFILIKMMNYGYANEIKKAIDLYSVQIKLKIDSNNSIYSLLFWARNTQEMLGLLKSGFKSNQTYFKGYTSVKKTQSVCSNTLKKILFFINTTIVDIITKDLAKEVLFTVPNDKHGEYVEGETNSNDQSDYTENSNTASRANIIITFFDQVLIELNKYGLSHNFINAIFVKIISYIMVQTFNVVISNKDLCKQEVCSDVCQNIADLEEWYLQNGFNILKTNACAPKQAFKLLKVLSSNYNSKGIPSEAFAKEYNMLSSLQMEIIIDNVSKNAQRLNSDLNELLVYFQSINSMLPNNSHLDVYIDASSATKEKIILSTKEVSALDISTEGCYLDIKLLKFIISSQLNRIDNTDSSENDSEFDIEFKEKIQYVSSNE